MPHSTWRCVGKVGSTGNRMTPADERLPCRQGVRQPARPLRAEAHADGAVHHPGPVPGGARAGQVRHAEHRDAADRGSVAVSQAGRCFWPVHAG